MPWDKASFRKHNRRATAHTAKVANAVLREGGGSDASAIRIANWQLKKDRLARKRKHREDAARKRTKS